MRRPNIVSDLVIVAKGFETAKHCPSSLYLCSPTKNSKRGPSFILLKKKYYETMCYVLAKLFNKCLKESCFPDCWKVSSVVPVFKNGERSTTALLVFFLWLVKSLKNL